MRTLRLALILSLLSANFCSAQNGSVYLDTVAAIQNGRQFVNPNVATGPAADALWTAYNYPGNFVTAGNNLSAIGQAFGRGVASLGYESTAWKDMLNLLNGVSCPRPQQVEIFNDLNRTASTLFRIAYRGEMYGSNTIYVRGIFPPGSVNLVQNGAMTYFERQVPAGINLWQYVDSIMYPTSGATGDAFTKAVKFVSNFKGIAANGVTIPQSTPGGQAYYSIQNVLSQGIKGSQGEITNASQLTPQLEPILDKIGYANGQIAQLGNTVFKGGTQGLKVLQNIALEAAQTGDPNVEEQEVVALTRVAYRNPAVLAALTTIAGNVSAYMAAGLGATLLTGLLGGAIAAASIYAIYKIGSMTVTSFNAIRQNGANNACGNNWLCDLALLATPGMSGYTYYAFNNLAPQYFPTSQQSGTATTPRAGANADATAGNSTVAQIPVALPGPSGTASGQPQTNSLGQTVTPTGADNTTSQGSQGDNQGGTKIDYVDTSNGTNIPPDQTDCYGECSNDVYTISVTCHDATQSCETTSQIGQVDSNGNITDPNLNISYVGCTFGCATGGWLLDNGFDKSDED